MKIAPTNKLLEGQVPNYTLYLGTYTNSASVTNICVNYMLCMMIQGPSINDITHLGGRGIGQKLTYLHISLSSKMGDKRKGGVKNFKKWVTSFMDGTAPQEVQRIQGLASFLHAFIYFKCIRCQIMSRIAFAMCH